MTRKCNEGYMLELAHKLDAIEPAASAMLAALKEAHDHLTGPLDTRRKVAAAIAAAKAAGIKAD